MKLNKAVVFSSNTDNIADLCAAANALCEQSVAAVLGTKAAAEGLCSAANKVVWMGERAEGTVVEAYTSAIEKIIKDECAALVLLSNGTRDRCIAAKLAVRLNASVVTDVAAISVDGGSVETKRNVYGGAAEATVKSVSAVTVALLPAGLFEAVSVSGELVEAAAEAEDCGIVLTGTAPKQEETVNLAAAKRIVGVGRGINGGDNLPAIEAFAAKIGAELGCTRPIAEEEHLMARGRYIGVSGVTIRPDVYVALGISGQVQHMVGASDSKLIIAINKDANAPIFKNCNYGLVADMHKVLAALTEQL